MSDEKKDPRKRVNLYKKKDDDEDVLKKLKEVRQNLQDSLDDKPPGTGPKPVRKRGERRLYKKEDISPTIKPAAKAKPLSSTVSKKRLAAVQKRVKAKVAASKSLSKKKKGFIVAWMVLISVPLFFISSIAVAALELNFNEFGLTYNENKPGHIIISFPARNPSFLPAHLGIFTMELLGEDPNTGDWEIIGIATTNDELDIGPYQTETLYVDFALTEERGGQWLSELLTDLKLTIKLGKIRYSGIEIDASFINEFSLDIAPLLTDAITGMLDIESLLGSLSFEDLLGGSATSLSDDGRKMLIDPYTNARMSTLVPRASQIAGMEDMTLNFSFEMVESVDQFSFLLNATISLSDLISTDDLLGITLGPIEFENLTVDLMVNNRSQVVHDYDSDEIKKHSDWWKVYDTPIATLSSTRRNKIYIGDKKNRASIIGLNVTVNKDNPYLLRDGPGGKYHPSADVDWTGADTSRTIDDFLLGTDNFSAYNEAWKDFPGWYFLYNILSKGGLDCGIKLDEIDLEMFGLKIPDISLPMSVLPPLKLDDGVLDPDNFLKIAPDYGLLGVIKHLSKGLTEGPARAFLGLPPSTSGEEKDLDTMLEDLTGMVEFPDINFDDIHESFGDDAELSIMLPITINNSLFDFYVGFSGMKVGIASEINQVVKTFIEVTVTGNETEEVYLAGINSSTTVNVSVVIYKNYTVAPFAVKFLSQLIENYTIDGIIMAEFESLVLFKENYTLGAFAVAVPLVMDIESILMSLIGEMLPSLIGGFVPDSNSTSLSGLNPLSPMGLMSAMNPLPALLTILEYAPTLNLVASQEEESDPIGDMINGLINDLIGSLGGGLLGGEMSFTLGLTVDVFPGAYTKFNILISDFLIDEFFITVGLGTTDMTLQGKNQLGHWEDMIGFQVENYFEIRENYEEDIAISLVIYESDALCLFLNKFLTDFFNESVTNVIDLRAFGELTLNLTGLFMPNLEIDFVLEELDLGLNGTELVESLVDMVYDIELGAGQGAPMLLNMWTGPIDTNVPFIAQGLDINELLLMGAISIKEISETEYGNSSEGIGTVRIGMSVVNYMMSMNIDEVKISIYDKHPTNKYGEGTPTRLIDIMIDDGVGLDYGANGELDILINIHKGPKCEQWINNFLTTLLLDGWINLSASINVFGCDLVIEDTYIPAINLTRLPIDLTTLLGAMMPFSAPFMNHMGPEIAQDIDMDSILGPDSNVLNFGIGKIKIGDYDKHVGPLNYTDSVMDLEVDLWIKTMFNMSIQNVEVNILDGDLYKALYLNGGHSYDDMSREAMIAQLSLVQNEVFLDNCIPFTWGAEMPTMDPNMPYLVNTSACWPREENVTDFECDVRFERDYTVVTGGGAPFNRNPGEGLNRTEFNDTIDGFTATNYMELQEGSLNNVTLKVDLFNKSHGTWENKYPRKFWKALGGPYFPVQRFGVEYGAFPDHMYVYHPYYAPLVNLMHKALALLDESGLAADETAISDLINGIAIGGAVNMTMFSMDIDLNLNNPKINALFEPISGLFLATTGYAIKEYISSIANPLKAAQHPEEQMMERMMAASAIDDLLGDLMDISSIPLDITDIIGGISFPGICDRTDHVFNPVAESQGGASRSWDGGPVYNLRNEYGWDPDDMRGYVGGLTDQYFAGGSTAGTPYSNYSEWDGYTFAPKEKFVKDYGYDWYKTVVDNWAESVNLNNPYFETNYSTSTKYMGGSAIEDPKDWPLLYSQGAFDGRCKTSVLTLHTGILPTFPFGLLSGRLSLWIEDPYNPCQYMPMGYVFINNSVMLMPIRDILDDPHVIANLDGHMLTQGEPNQYGYTYDTINTAFTDHGTLIEPEDMEESDFQNRLDTVVMGLCTVGTNRSADGSQVGYQIDQYGNMHNPGWVLNFNIRFFEGISSHEFFWQMISGGDFNIHFLAQGNVNVSLFGYEFYNLFLPYDIAQLGDASRFEQKCLDYQENQGSGGGYGNWGLPGANGSVGGEIHESTDYSGYWPHYLLKAASLEFGVSLPIEAILDFESFLDFGTLLGGIAGIGISGGGLVIDVEMPITNPVPLVLWIESVYIRLDIEIGGTSTTPPALPWTNAIEIDIDSTQNIPLIDLTGAGWPGYNPTDPFDYRYNSYYNWHTPHPITLSIQATIPLDIGRLIDLLLAVLFGDPVWMMVGALEIRTTIPSPMSYRYNLVIDLGDMQEPMPLEIL